MAGGVAGGAAAISGSVSDRRNAKQIVVPEKQLYKASQYAKQRLGLASMALNSTMPGQEEAKRQIYSNVGNQVGAASRAATDGSQVLAAASQAGVNANNAFLQQQQQQAGWQAQQQQNYYGALDNMQQQDMLEWQDKEALRQERQQRRDAYNNASRQGLIGGIAALSGAFGNASRGVYGSSLQKAFNYGQAVPQTYGTSFAPIN